MASHVVQDTAAKATTPTVAGVGTCHLADAPVLVRHRVRRWLAHRAIRAMMLAHRTAMVVATPIGYIIRPRRRTERLEILLTGTFYSDNWVNAHVRPLAASERCARVWLVSTWPVPPTPKMVAVCPPAWLVRCIGAVPARLAVFVWLAIWLRPDLIGGFHLLVNGLVAQVLARLVGARSLYFCVGGPQELLGGGIGAENRLFGKMETADHIVERRLLNAVGAFDLVITMGTRAVEFFRHHEVKTCFHVVSGGMDAEQFGAGCTAESFDLILVGRLVEIKRIDVFLEAVKHVSDRLPQVTAAIIGDGALRVELQRRARELGLDGAVRFLGHQKNVGAWLRQAKVFVLTSDSEGLALSLMEAMTCGLPAVVSRVGDLPDLVEDGVNGYLVERRCPERFADRIVQLLTDEAERASVASAARRAAMRYQAANVTKQWDAVLAERHGHVYE